MQLLSLRRTVFAVMLLVWGTLAEVNEDDIDSIKTGLEQEKETLSRNEAEIWRWLGDTERGKDNQPDKEISSSLVGFTAELSTNQNLPPLKTIVFDKVLENLGGGYNPNTGVFTAPCKGMYLFSANIHSQPRQQVHLVLNKNYSYIGRVVAGNSNSDFGDSGSVSVITTLNKNDEVFLKGMFSVRIYGDQWSSFTGVLISRFY